MIETVMTFLTREAAAWKSERLYRHRGPRCPVPHTWKPDEVLAWTPPSSPSTSAHTPFLLRTQLELSLCHDKVRVLHLFWTETGHTVPIHVVAHLPLELNGEAGRHGLGSVGCRINQASCGTSGKSVQLCSPRLHKKDDYA